MFKLTLKSMKFKIPETSCDVPILWAVESFFMPNLPTGYQIKYISKASSAREQKKKYIPFELYTKKHRNLEWGMINFYCLSLKDITILKATKCPVYEQLQLPGKVHLPHD